MKYRSCREHNFPVERDQLFIMSYRLKVMGGNDRHLKFWGPTKWGRSHSKICRVRKVHLFQICFYNLNRNHTVRKKSVIRHRTQQHRRHMFVYFIYELKMKKYTIRASCVYFVFKASKSTKKYWNLISWKWNTTFRILISSVQSWITCEWYESCDYLWTGLAKRLVLVMIEFWVLWTCGFIPVFSKYPELSITIYVLMCIFKRIDVAV